jgi:hypothetical protein
MITVEQNTQFQAVLFSNRTGLEAALTAEIIRPPSEVVFGPVGGATVAGDGNIYIVTLMAPAADDDLYLIRWDGPSLSAVEELRVIEGAPPSQALGLMPDVADVGALIRFRTKQRGTNVELGTFAPASAPYDEGTRPTREEVERLIGMAVEDVANACSISATSIPIQLRNMGRALAAKGAAMLVEVSYPEQINSDRSAFNALRSLYNDALPRFCAAVSDAIAADPTAEQTENLLPLYYFDDSTGPFVAPGRETPRPWRDPSINRYRDW